MLFYVACSHFAILRFVSLTYTQLYFHRWKTNKEARRQTLPDVDILQELGDIMKTKSVKFSPNTLYIFQPGARCPSTPPPPRSAAYGWSINVGAQGRAPPTFVLILSMKRPESLFKVRVQEGARCPGAPRFVAYGAELQIPIHQLVPSRYSLFDHQAHISFNFEENKKIWHYSTTSCYAVAWYSVIACAI